MNSSQLSRWLKKNQPPNAWLVCSDEPLQLSESLDAIRQHAREHGCDEREVLRSFETGFQWQDLMGICSSMSLFSSKRLIEVHMGNKDPGKNGSTSIKQILQQQNPGVLLLFSYEKNDGRTRKTAWYKAFADNGEIVGSIKVSPNDLPNWLVARAKSLGFSLEVPAAEWIADRTEGNLLAAAQELQLWAMLQQDIVRLDDVLNSVSDNARFNVFDLLQHAWLGNSKKTFRMLRGLRDEGMEPVALLGALMWDLRRLCVVAASSDGNPPNKSLLMQNGIYGDRQQAAVSLIKRTGISGMYKFLGAALNTERILKTGDKERGWRSMHWLFLLLCSPNSKAFPE